MKKTYIELMDHALEAYSEEHIQRYFADVQKNGLTEHGFPRLTANIGILLAFGKRGYLKPIFMEMMEFCCKNIPHVRAANDFSVREVVACISEIEKSGVIDKETVVRWKKYLSEIDPLTCYNVFAKSPTDKVKNWALFTAVSEFFRKQMGLGGSDDFIDTQLASQLQWLDENGMYMDGRGEFHHPMVYDLVPRALFAMLLHAGYQGKYASAIDDCLKRAGLLTLKMQSPNGEIAFGGRSNQFLHNEPWMIAIYEYEANRYSAQGNQTLAGEFKSAIKRAVQVTEEWLSQEPTLHIKNRFPLDSMYGCENYAYFDKYMITTASVLFSAYQICDDRISENEICDTVPTVFRTSNHFHKLFLNAHGYGLEFDLNADSHYDATGLGRIHRENAPAAICLSVPCPSNPAYAVDIENPIALSFCPGVLCEKKWIFANDSETKNEIQSLFCDEDSACTALRSVFSDGQSLISQYTVNADGVRIEISGNDDIAYQIPAFFFDGEVYTEITVTENMLSISYKGWICRYTVDGQIIDNQMLCANRNGHYRSYTAVSKNKLCIQVEIFR